MKNSKKLITLFIGFLMLLSSFRVFGQEEIFNYYADFEAGESNLFEYMGSVREFTLEKGRNCYKVKSNLPTDEPAGLKKAFTPGISGKILLEAKVNWIYPGDGDHGEVFLINSNPGILFSQDGNITFGDLNLGAWTHGQWYSVKMLIDTALPQHNADIYINEIKQASAVSTDITSIQDIAIHPYSTTRDGRGLIDDVRITNDRSFFPVDESDQVLIASSIPADRSSNVSVITDVSFTFNKEISNGTAIKENFAIEPATEIQDVILNNDGKTVTLVLPKLLDGTLYTVTVKEGLEDIDGNPAENSSITFQTIAPAEKFDIFSDFNDGTFGAYSQSGYGEVSENFGRMCAKIKSEGTMNGVIKNFQTPLSGKVLFEAYVNWMYPEDGDHGEVFKTSAADGASFNGIQFHVEDKTITYDEEGKKIPLGTWEHREWIKVTMVVDLNTKKAPADIYINDVKQAAGVLTNARDITNVGIYCYSTTNAGRGAMDDFRITNDPQYIPDDDAKIVSSFPANHAQEVDIETQVFLTFDKEIDETTVTKENFSVSEEHTVIKDVILKADKKTCVIQFMSPLKAKTTYEVAVKEGLKTTIGSGVSLYENKITFTTNSGKTYISDIAFSYGNESATQLKNGLLDSSVKISNLSDSNRKIHIVTAYCKQIGDSYIFIDYTTGAKELQAGETGTIQTQLAIDHFQSNRFVKLFIVEDLESFIPIKQSVILR